MVEEMVFNEFGESVSRKVIADFARKIMNLSKVKIDELWAKAGWKEAGCEPNKSLPDWRLEKIKKEEASALSAVENLFLETPLEDFNNLFNESIYYFMEDGKIELSLENFFPQDLSKEIIDYLISKSVKEVKLRLFEEKEEKPIDKYFNKNEFEKLRKEIENSLCDDGLNFCLNVPEIKSYWEEFVYGVDATSCQKDFRDIFSKYESD